MVVIHVNGPGGITVQRVAAQVAPTFLRVPQRDEEDIPVGAVSTPEAGTPGLGRLPRLPRENLLTVGPVIGTGGRALRFSPLGVGHLLGVTLALGGAVLVTVTFFETAESLPALLPVGCGVVTGVSLDLVLVLALVGDAMA